MSDSERRSSERIVSRRRIRVKLFTRGGICDAVISDVADMGVGVICSKPFAAETQVVITYERPIEFPAIHGIVRHSTKLQDGSWLVGCWTARAWFEEEWSLLVSDEISGLRPPTQRTLENNHK